MVVVVGRRRFTRVSTAVRMVAGRAVVTREMEFVTVPRVLTLVVPAVALVVL